MLVGVKIVAGGTIAVVRGISRFNTAVVSLVIPLELENGSGGHHFLSSEDCRCATHMHQLPTSATVASLVGRCGWLADICFDNRR